MENKELLTTARDRLLKMFCRKIRLPLVDSLFILLLIYTACILITKEPVNTATIMAVFRSTGLITAYSARISRFFNRTFTLVEDRINGTSR